MVTRVATFATQQALIQRMLEVQKRVFDGQTQVGTEKKSQDYIGIATDSFRLINIENEKSRVERFINNNTSAETTLKAMNASVKSIDDIVRNLRQELIGFTGRDLTDQSPQDVSAVNDIQERAFAALNDFEFFLNLKIDGKYVFGGGKTDVPPVSIPYNNVQEFQADFDGIKVTYPTTRAAQLVDAKFDNVTVTNNTNLTYGTPATNVVQVDAAANTFVTSTVNDSSFGALTYAGTATNGTITSSLGGAFSNLEVGQTFALDQSSSNGIYTVTGVSADGRTITLDQPIAAGTDASGAVMRFLPPNGSTIFVSNSALGNNGAYTVRWPTNAELGAAPFGGTVLDGSQIFLTGQLGDATPETLNFRTRPYYGGDRLETQHRVSETRTVKFGVNGLDPAFEKAIRSIGQLLQGDLMNNQQRAVDALALINDAIEHSPLSTEKSGDLQDIQNRLGINQKVLADAKDDQKQFIAFLEVRQIEIENVDPTEAAVRLNDDVRALNISFATLSRVQQLSLVDYL
ncbi:MAG: flagellin [Rhodospirillaceae bacterium]|nr:flagellin [Rhodospirillaceae bacterium]